MISIGSQQALQNMVELEMYLVAQAGQTPWPILPRRTGRAHEGRELYSNAIEPRAAIELIDIGFIEPTSSRTFVVSESGHQFYDREMKSLSA